MRMAARKSPRIKSPVVMNLAMNTKSNSTGALNKPATIASNPKTVMFNKIASPSKDGTYTGRLN